MPRFDFKCPACGKLYPDVWISSFRDATDTHQERFCESCGQRLEKLPAAPNFQVHGFSAKNGYSK